MPVIVRMCVSVRSALNVSRKLLVGLLNLEAKLFQVLKCGHVVLAFHSVLRYGQRKMTVSQLKAKPAHFRHGAYLYAYKVTGSDLNGNYPAVIFKKDIAVVKRLLHLYADILA